MILIELPILLRKHTSADVSELLEECGIKDDGVVEKQATPAMIDMLKVKLSFKDPDTGNALLVFENETKIEADLSFESFTAILREVVASDSKGCSCES
jgi:hypothetical protein